MQETFWKFETARFKIEAIAHDDHDMDMSWDDDGSAREGIESGKYVAFMVEMRVSLDGKEIASDYLGGCIYDSLDQFASGHRDSDPMNRNCSIRGDNVIIGHYFPDMVATACQMARDAINETQLPRMRH